MCVQEPYCTVLYCTVLQEPYSVTLQLELDSLHSATVVRLLYERVPYHYDATVAILDTPVVEEVMPVTSDIFCYIYAFSTLKIH